MILLLNVRKKERIHLKWQIGVLPSYEIAQDVFLLGTQAPARAFFTMHSYHRRSTHT